MANDYTENGEHFKHMKSTKYSAVVAGVKKSDPKSLTLRLLKMQQLESFLDGLEKHVVNKDTWMPWSVLDDGPYPDNVLTAETDDAFYKIYIMDKSDCQPL